jgi:hypothetical protein
MKLLLFLSNNNDLNLSCTKNQYWNVNNYEEINKYKQ